VQKPIVKYSIIFLLLLVYINRGVFVTPYEIENQSNKEINTVAEWLVELITGESNDIDEDGDMHTDCNSVNTVHHDFSQQIAQRIELMNLFSIDLNKLRFLSEEKIPVKDFYSLIERPPEV